MKLYYSPGACSLAPHIALHEAGLKYESEKVDLRSKKTESGKDFLTINPKGYVPALILDNGELLTEAAVMLQYIADKAANSHLMPAFSNNERYHFLEWLNFISAELHKGIGSLFTAAMPEEFKPVVRERVAVRLAYVEQHLASGKTWLWGQEFSILDAYAFTVINWTKTVKIPLDTFPAIQAWKSRVAARPAVQAAMKAEGLIKG